MLIGPLAVAAATPVVCWFLADSAAEKEFFTRYAAAHELAHFDKSSVNSFTPLLGAGDRRHCEHWMEGKGTAIGWYTFEVKKDNGDKPDTWEPHNFTLAMSDLGELDMARYQGIYVRRKRGILGWFDGKADWLESGKPRKIELESTAFCEEFELWM